MKIKPKIKWDPNPLSNLQRDEDGEQQEGYPKYNLMDPKHREFGSRITTIENDAIEVYPPGVDTRGI